MSDSIQNARRLWKEQKYVGSVKMYHQLLLLDPESIDILTDMIQIYSEIKQIDFCFQMAQRLEIVDADNILAKYYQARCLFVRNQLFHSRRKLMEILNTNPKHKGSLILLSQICFEQHNYGLALKINQQIDDDDTNTLEQRASTLVELGQCKMANEIFKLLWERVPTNRNYYSNYFQTLMFLDGVSNQYIREQHELLNSVLPQDISEISRQRVRKEGEKIRIGYVSCDLCNHPVSNCLLPIVKHHNRDTFEVYVFASNSQKSDEITKYFHDFSEQFVTLSASPTLATQQIIEMNIDVLIDTIGHTGHHILPLFHQRLAPIQISMIGYCGPSGIKNMDYVVVDDYTVPSNNHEQYNYFHEKLIYQSPIFAPYMPLQELPSCTRDKKVPGLRFASTHKIPKISRHTIRMWSAVLREVPYSTMCFYRDGLCEESIQQIKSQFLEHGIEENQLEFHTKIFKERSSHLEIYQEIDFLLDVHPWSGHITACESLAMGVPIITISGNNHAGRMVASILHCLGREEWIAPTVDDYVECVLTAVDRWSSNQRKRLRKEFLKSSICNGLQYTQNFEENIQKMIKKNRSPLP